MSDYAIPGLMPQTSPYFASKNLLPSTTHLICVYAGRADDEVGYLIQTSGPRASYIGNFCYPFLSVEQGCRLMQSPKENFIPLIKSTSPQDAVICRRVVDGKSVEVVEESPVEPIEAWWYLELPAGRLPYGNHKLMVAINSVDTRTYILTSQVPSSCGDPIIPEELDPIPAAVLLIPANVDFNYQYPAVDTLSVTLGRDTSDFEYEVTAVAKDGTTTAIPVTVTDFLLRMTINLPVGSYVLQLRSRKLGTTDPFVDYALFLCHANV